MYYGVHSCSCELHKYTTAENSNNIIQRQKHRFTDEVGE